MCTPICCSSQVQNTVCQLLPISEYTCKASSCKACYIYIGDKAKVEIDFYASIHQEKDEQDAKDIGTCDKTSTGSEIRMIMPKIRQNEADEDNVMDAVHPSDSERVHKLKERLGAVKEDIEQKLEIDNHFREGVEKFLNRYESMQGPKSLARLSSSFHKFGWVFGGHTSSARNNSVFL